MIKYLSSQNLKKFVGETCLLRIDLNVEIGMPLDSYRLEAVIPTVQLLFKNNVRVVLMSHRGRPEGFDKELSLKPFAKIFAKRIGRPVTLLSDFNFEAVKKEVSGSEAGSVFLLENLRFLPGEEKNDAKLAKQLASFGDLFVNDAFAVSHRANASVAAITKYLPSYAGLLLEKEIKNLDKAMKSHKHPFTVAIGGVKISDKLGVMRYFWKKADDFLIGGGPANTFLKAKGVNVGQSLIDAGSVSLMKPYLNSKKIHLPMDVKRKGTKILDIGPKTAREYADIIKKSRTIIWNGPMGWFERKEFSGGTKAVWKAVLANKKAHIVVGGGETITSLKTLFPRPLPRRQAGYTLNPNLFLSTGGGAMLEYLSGKKLPGIVALKR